jgi:hypothetical protein
MENKKCLKPPTRNGTRRVFSNPKRTYGWVAFWSFCSIIIYSFILVFRVQKAKQRDCRTQTQWNSSGSRLLKDLRHSPTSCAYIRRKKHVQEHVCSSIRLLVRLWWACRKKEHVCSLMFLWVYITFDGSNMIEVIVMFHVFSFRIVRSYFKCSPRLVAPGCSLACGEHMFTSRAMVKQISRAMFDVIGFTVNSIGSIKPWSTDVFLARLREFRV